MKNKVQIVINTLVIIFMPFMMYVDVSGSKVNASMSDILMVPVGILFLLCIKEFFICKRWRYPLYFVGLLLSIFLSQYVSLLDDEFLHVQNSVMFVEMVKTIVITMYFFTAYMFVNSERDLKVSLAAISLSSIPVMLIGALSYTYFLLGKEFFIDIYKIENLRFFGSFEDPNLCALYFIHIFFVSFMNFKIHKNKFLRFLMLGISILSLIIIILTMSRGGWLALAGAVAVFILLNIKNLKKKNLLLIATATIALLFIFVEMDYSFQDGEITNYMVDRVQDSLNTDVEDINRVQLMKAAFSMGNDNFFFGVGKGSFPLNSYKYLSEDNIQYKRQLIPHNTILGLYAQQGIIGVFIFVMLPGYILYSMICSKRKQNSYFIALFTGFFIHSMTINIENVRFLWYMLGLMLASENLNINVDFMPVAKMNKKVVVFFLTILLPIGILLGVDVSRKIVADIYVCKGDTYERTVSLSSPGDYQLDFDILTDNNMHSVEVYDGNILQKKMNFRSAYGFVKVPVHIKENCKVIFKSNENGWMKVKNAYLTRDNEKIPLNDYVLLPKLVEDLANRQGLLVYPNESSFKTQIKVGDDELSVFDILKVSVTRYSNLSHILQFNMKSKKKVDTNYQLELLVDHPSISDLLPNEIQRNLWTYRFNLPPLTSKWEVGQEYKVETTRLFSSETFDMYGRYYDYANNVYSQESYFPVEYYIEKENQEIVELGKSQWINIRYNRDEEGNIHVTNNGWVETGRMNIPKGDYNITFKAQGSFLDEYSKLRLRDSFLNEIAEITLSDTMKEYTVKYHTDDDQKGISFILELVNYKSEKGIGNREVLLEDWVRVK